MLLTNSSWHYPATVSLRPHFESGYYAYSSVWRRYELRGGKDREKETKRARDCAVVLDGEDPEWTSSLRKKTGGAEHRSSFNKLTQAQNRAAGQESRSRSGRIYWRRKKLGESYYYAKATTHEANRRTWLDNPPLRDDYAIGRHCFTVLDAE